MGEQIQAIAQRLSMLREALDITPEEMAKELDISVSEYLEYEAGKNDFAFSFLFGCANKLGWTSWTFLPERPLSSPIFPW